MNVETISTVPGDAGSLNYASDCLQRRDLESSPQRRHIKRVVTDSRTKRLESSARQSLFASAYRELDQLTVSVRSGKLHLGGQLRSYYLKQVAQTILLNHCRLPLVNDVKVVYENAGGISQ